MTILEQIAEKLRNGEASEVAELVQKGLDEGLGWEDIMNNGLFAGMKVVGKLFKEEDIFVPEVLMAAKAMDAGSKVLEPLIASDGSGERHGKVVLATVKGDVHNLGKNLVNVMLRGAGFEVTDLGENVPAERIIDAVVSEKAQLVGMSALLTTTMPYMRTVIEALSEAGLEGQVKTIIGGACVTQDYADEIGADGYADNAGAAVDKAKELLASK